MLNPRQSEQDDLPTANRAYNLRMRDIYFGKACRILSRLGKGLHKALLKPDLSTLGNVCNALDIALDFARQAVAGQVQAKKKDETLSRQPPLLLREEVLYLHLLEELASSGRFLKTRFNTIVELGKYRDGISALPLDQEVVKGYITQIMYFLDENRKAEEEEIRAIITLILKRMHLINHIQSITRKANG
ncbi:MAG: hypothetical protein A2268_12070 [Candidatus Raymondbacteria bacterium RifOxyA12_full_50_37]|uniref:Uncharacterized protein n=1 Tax=Candidatus Raymondbacteria bacterium RIFOXYD12_FULL_49_13 TaxID=1817890 RepID=A0A1F7F0Y2_UNCRA|nr:MAG: hypothetical protein A2268_12070 [Candidatus Raymondbacteria bacterium RifOxyA12_full_50_37]OGJ86054.1 MAG: hypothetical protein A2248_02065 [Candidatus Raymondbacteria bacterium RIFOXYA2_FULL_49_16]OGJ95951.1 MAG: hypothetical protein A2453_05470 [Candidatus Raymondbacteria bacterium RIFOXYC2_FULL_50_21]OGK00197.1 MAG: hypothetical protein A2519_20525 [Candidatus Raymondbacteria bacterium RIFOXYD12_FULL_49_13]OGK03903.1 MAG: hypothetical protein A2350_02460 [Candidatus Raymondbacteria 